MRETDRLIKQHDPVIVAFVGYSSKISYIDRFAGRSQSGDGIFRLPAKVVDVHPNGKLVIEG